MTTPQNKNKDKEVLRDTDAVCTIYNSGDRSDRLFDKMDRVRKSLDKFGFIQIRRTE